MRRRGWLAVVVASGVGLASLGVLTPPAGAVLTASSGVGAAAGRAVDTAHPTRVVGDGRAGSCTSKAVVAAVARGGVITFSCGQRPVTILMRATAKVRNTSAQVVLDGGGKVTLNGGHVRRILYMDTCDPAQVWTTSHCQNQAEPKLTVQNLTFIDGNSTGQRFDGGGGGAIFDRGGQLRIVDSRFIDNRCDSTGCGPGRGGRQGAQPVPRAPGLRRAQHLPGRRVLQRRGTEQHRRVLGGAQ